MTEFGHKGFIGGGCVDSWGAGPFLMTVGEKTYRFEDSDRFGPVFIRKNGAIKAEQPGSRSPFWEGYGPWIQQGRQLAEGGATCIWKPFKPTLYHIVGRNEMVIDEEGDAGGEFINVGEP